MSYQEDKLKEIADAIREKEGSTGSIPAKDFPSRISAIETGVDTSDATATYSDIVSPKTAYVNGKKITGTIRENPTGNITGDPTAGTIAMGSYGDDYPTVGIVCPLTQDIVGRRNKHIYASCSSSLLGNATAADVLSGKTFSSSNGIKIAGIATIPTMCTVLMRSVSRVEYMEFWAGEYNQQLANTYINITVPKNSYIFVAINADSSYRYDGSSLLLVKDYTTLDYIQFLIFRVLNTSGYFTAYE